MAEEVIGLLFGVDGGGSIDGRSGQQIVSDLTKIVNQINSGKSTVPKVQLKFDTSHAKTALQELRSQLQEIAGMGNISVSGMSSRGGSGGSAGVKQDAENYRALTATVKQYYAALAEVEKIQMKSTAVSSSGGVWSTTDAQYDARIQKVNQLKMEFDKLGISSKKSGVVEMNSAQQLNITEKQRYMLLARVRSAIINNGVAHKDSERKISDAWGKNAAKVHEYILRIQDVASKNAEVNALMTELNTLAASGNPKNLDELTAKFAKLQQKVRETNADVQTFGQKLAKTFGSQLRYMLTSMVYMKALQFIRDLYNNVVELDKAMVNLQIASGKSRAEVKKMTKDYAELAKQLGATTVDVAESADTWLRQGYATEEANTLIRNSTMLAKLGQMEATEASKALTSAMKGYKVSVEDSIGIVDKFTAVDMEAAASAGDIATAMAETATSADIAGVSMNRLIGYLAVVKEVTQDGAESVGTFYRTLFARMNNVAAGKFVDDETGESLNDVETVLNELGIALRNADGQFRESGDVLDEVASRWQYFDNTAQHAIATAFAGTRQQEKFIVLMENYGTAIKYAETAAGSAGTAVEKFGDYTEGIEGKTNSLKASFEALSMAVLNSELITGAVGFVSWLLDAIAWVMDKIGGLNTILYLTLGILATIKADSIFSFIAGIIPKIIGLVTTLWSNVTTLAATFVAARASGMSMGQSVSAAFAAIGVSASAAQVAVGAFVAVLGLALVIANSAKQKSQELVRQSLSSAEAYKRESAAHKQNAESIEELVEQYKALAEANNGVYDTTTAEEVRGIQNKITDLVGEQAKNLDLVNGKLDDQLEKLNNISKEQYKAAYADAKVAVSDAENAYKEEASSKTFWGTRYEVDANAATRNGFYELAKQYGIKVQDNVYYSSEGMSVAVPNIKFEFDDVNDFVKQYEAVLALKQALALEGKNDTPAYKEAAAFISDFEELYTSYTDAKELCDALYEAMNSVGESNEETKDAVKGTVVALKSSYDILIEVQDGYDGLAKALGDVTGEGYLTADALATLFKLEKDNALAGLQLADILTLDANGYKLAGDALQQYVAALIAAKSKALEGGAFATQKDKENAIANLQTLQAVLATLAATQNESTDASKARREELEKEQDMYQDQLDKFEELIDLRKDLLQTYKEELDYQKELEKRQQNVTALQTRLSVAKLDQSAAGQARVRELEAELKEAQDDLEDFTLEHAIDVLTDQLDSTNAEWKAIIQGKLNEITSLLEALDTTSEVNITMDTSWVQGAISQIAGLITDVGKKGTGEQWSEYWYTQNPGVYGPPPPMPDGWTLPTSYSTALQEYRNAIQRLTDDMVADNKANGRPESYAVSSQQWLARYSGAMSTSNIATAKAAYEWLRSYYTSITGKVPNYHNGGLVGDIVTLSSGEEFAKLLKGEFVSTPAQMKRFMEETLPKIANYSATGGSNEFNAPLIEITCESVTTEALPELERIVNEAVKEIKRELDSGMSRTGFKRTPTKRLT